MTNFIIAAAFASAVALLLIGRSWGKGQRDSAYEKQIATLEKKHRKALRELAEVKYPSMVELEKEGLDDLSDADLADMAFRGP